MENQLFEEFLSFENLLRRYLLWQRKGKGNAGTPHRGQGRVLALLKIQPEITQKELTYLLDMRPQSLGELLTKLEKNEFITREPSEDDRRVMVVKLTAAGKAEAERLSQENTATIFDQLSEAEQEQFAAILAKLSQIMQAELPEEALQGGFDPDMRRKMMEEFKRGGFGGGHGPRRGGFPGFGGRDFRGTGRGDVWGFNPRDGADFSGFDDRFRKNV